MIKFFTRGRLAAPSALLLFAASMSVALLPLAASANTGNVVGSEDCATWSATVLLDNNVTADHLVDVVASPSFGHPGFVGKSFTTTGNAGPTPIWGPFTGSAPLTGTVTLTIHLPGGAIDGTPQAVTLTPPANCVKNSPAINTTLSAGSITVPGSVHDSSALTGATTDASGTVAYAVYTDGACSQGAIDAGTKTVSNGVVPDSNPVSFITAGTYSWQATYSGDARNNGAKSSCGSETLVAKAPVTQALRGHIYDCSNGTQTTTEVAAGSTGKIGATGPTTVSAAPNPMTAPVSAGTYDEQATAPNGFHFVSCAGAATVNTPTTATYSGIVVPSGGSGAGVFYVAANPTMGTLAGHIYDCSTGTPTATEVLQGTLAAAGPTPIAASANPIGPAAVVAGIYVVSPTAPANYMLVACGGAGPAPQTVTVPAGGTVSVDFFVAHQTGTLSANIYDCTNGVLGTTDVAGGSVSAAGPTPIAAQANPLAPTTVNTGSPYTVTASAPTAYHFVPCAGQAANGTRTVTVPANGSAQAVYYVSHDTGTLAGHIYDCTNGATSNEVTGGTLGATGATPVATQGNPLGSVVVQTGNYTVTATAPAGYTLAACNGKGAGGTQPVTVQATTPGTAAFYVTKNPTPTNNGGAQGANGANGATVPAGNNQGAAGAQGAFGAAGANGATQPVTGRSELLRALMASLLLVSLGAARAPPVRRLRRPRGAPR